jgi:hypothetical protein
MQWLAQFIVVYSVPYMIRNITYGTFIFFGSCTVVAFVFAFLFVPETKGVPLEDMDLLLGADAPVFAPTAWRNYKEKKAAGINATVMHTTMGKEQGEVSQLEMLP